MQTLEEVIKRPVISEKGTNLTEKFNQYQFEVSAAANKQEIADAIARLFKVKVARVRTMVMHGKFKAVGGRTSRSIVKQSNWKKAVVTLAEGQKIEFFKS